MPVDSYCSSKLLPGAANWQIKPKPLIELMLIGYLSYQNALLLRMVTQGLL